MKKLLKLSLLFIGLTSCSVNKKITSTEVIESPSYIDFIKDHQLECDIREFLNK